MVDVRLVVTYSLGPKDIGVSYIPTVIKNKTGRLFTHYTN